MDTTCKFNMLFKDDIVEAAPSRLKRQFGDGVVSNVSMVAGGQPSEDTARDPSRVQANDARDVAET